MKALKLTVRGRVQKVGYRRLVDEVAYHLEVAGHVKNLEDGKTVEIIAEHEDEAVLKKFVEKVKIREYPIRVEKIETNEIEPKGYEEFEVIEGPLEIENRESLEAGAIYMRKLAGEMKQTRIELGGKQDKTLEKQDKMLEKQDETIKVLGSKMDSGFTNLGNKLDRFSDGTSERFDTMEQKYGKVSENLEAISKDLHELVEILKAFKPKE